MTRSFGIPLVIILIASAVGYGARTPRQFVTSASAAQERATSVRVDMEDIKFDPNEFTIPANTDVTVTLDNKGALPHDFSITDHKNPSVKNLNISVTLQPGKSQTITINAPAGDYYFYCNAPGHEAAGMFGTMHVVAGGESSSASTSSTGEATSVATTPTVSTGVTVEMVDIAFKPNALAIPANTPVKVELKNTGALPHNFSIDKLHISRTVQPGQTAEMTINAPAGTYQYYCNEPGHKAAGMVGTLTVVATAERHSNLGATPAAVGAGGEAPLAPTVAALATTVAELTTRVAALEIAVASGNHAAATSPAAPGTQTVSGAGTMVSEKFHLEPGRYKVTASVNVTSDDDGFLARLYGPNGTENALFSTFNRQSGTWTGSTIATVDAAGDYFVVVSNTESSWSLTFEPF